MPLPCEKHLLLSPENVPPSHKGWEVIGVFNPAAVEYGDQIVLLLRVAEQPVQRKDGQVGLPRWVPGRGPTVDWFARSEVEFIDARLARPRGGDHLRLTFLSYLRLAVLDHPTAKPRIEPVCIVPEDPWEEFGVEDPRISLIDGRYWITYVAVSRHGVATAVASTDDFRAFQRHGLIFPPDNKDVVVFPERIGERFAALHRPSGGFRFARPEMWIAFSPDLKNWGGHRPLWSYRAEWENDRLGAGVPPFRLEQGWLEIYHGSGRARSPGTVGTYQAGALLLDPNSPERVIAYSPQPILCPTEDFESGGFIPKVVFPTGLVRRGDRLYLYYGVGDTFTAVAAIALPHLLDALLPLEPPPAEGPGPSR